MDLSEALPQLTGNSYPAFKEVRIETSAEGAMVSIARQGIIFVARADGIAQTGQSAVDVHYFTPTQEVVQSAILLDVLFETTVPVSVQRAHRMHEFGHALAWTHVNTVPSVMNSTVPNVPTEFDRIGSRLAFLRSPGNATPDIDAVEATIKGVQLTRAASEH